MDRELKKSLSDRLYDKRKLAALDLEQLIRDLLAKGELDRIQAIIRELSTDFAYAVRHPNYRNGGLIGLAAVSIALGQVELAAYLDDVVPPVLSCFGDADSRVRYYACESLYNVAKVAKGEILQFFNEIFDILGKLVADPEESVRNGADLVDRLLKDIVAEKATTYTFLISREAPAVVPPVTETNGTSPAFQAAPSQTPNSFSLANFIPVLVERVYVVNPSTRMFLVQWIVLLDSIPDLNLVSYLAEFLEGLFQFLSDPNREVRVATKAALDGFLREIKAISKLKTLAQKDMEERRSTPTIEPPTGQNTPIEEAPSPVDVSSVLGDTSSLTAGLYTVGQDTFIDYGRLISITLENLDSTHEELRFAALEWLGVFLEVSPSYVTSDITRLAAVLLPTLSEQNKEIKEAGRAVNTTILNLIKSQQGSKIDHSTTVNALSLQFLNEEEVTRLAALDWLVALQGLNPEEPSKLALSTIIKLLGDPSDLVVDKDIELLAQILDTAQDASFKDLLAKVITHFQRDRKLLESRGKYTLSRLCQILNPERLYRTLAAILNEEADKEFAATIVQHANNILLMSPDLQPLRLALRGLGTDQGATLFVTLFKSWSWNAVSALSLCLLAEAYEHAFAVLQTLANGDISVTTLVNIDRLVQLIESPIFARLRLQLLEPQIYPYLYKCLYGLMMVLPQSTAFTTLQNRLQSVVAVSSLPPIRRPPLPRTRTSTNIEWSALLDGFRQAQASLSKSDHQIKPLNRGI